MKSRRSRWSAIAVSLGATAVAATGGADAVAQDLNLKLSREIEPPVRRTITPLAPAAPAPDIASGARDRRDRRAASRLAGAGARPPPPPAAPATSDERGAIFLRADRLEGTGRQAHRSRGQGGTAHAARDRARRLARVRLHERHDLGQGRRDAAPRPRLDQRAGSEDPARARDRLLRRAEVLHQRECVARPGEGDPLRRPRSLRGDQRAVHELRGAQQRLVPAQRRDRGGQAAQGRHRAQRERVLPRRAGVLHAVARVSAVQRAQVRLPHADDRLHAGPRLRDRHAVLLQSRAELRRDAGAAAHDAARPADRRRGPLPLRQRGRRGDRRDPAGRPRDRHGALGRVVEAQPADRAVARGLRQLQPRLGRHLLRGLRRSHLGHVAEDAAAGGGTRRELRAVLDARAGAGVPDAAGPAGAGDAAVQHAAAGPRADGRDRRARPHLVRPRRVRALRRVVAGAHGQPLDDLSVRALHPAGQLLVRQRARGHRRVAVQPERADHGDARTGRRASRCR